jgi:hypothetical protein
MNLPCSSITPHLATVSSQCRLESCRPADAQGPLKWCATNASSASSCCCSCRSAAPTCASSTLRRAAFCKDRQHVGQVIVCARVPELRQVFGCDAPAAEVYSSVIWHRNKHTQHLRAMRAPCLQPRTPVVPTANANMCVCSYVAALALTSRAASAITCRNSLQTPICVCSYVAALTPLRAATTSTCMISLQRSLCVCRYAAALTLAISAATTITCMISLQTPLCVSVVTLQH